jgi:glycosyltransferase involved in cell wall biosynthesis
MKILWISHGNTLFGAERCLIEFMEATAQSHDNYVVFPDRGEIVEMSRPFVKEARIIRTGWWVSFPGYSIRTYLRKYNELFRSIFTLRKFIREIKPDVVISNSIVTVHGAIAAKLSGIPHFYYIHEYVEEDHNMRFDLGTKWACKLANRMSKAFLVGAVGVKNKFGRFLPADKIYTLKCVVNVPPFAARLSRDQGRLELLVSGRVSETKGQIDAIKAMGILKPKGYDIHLTILGMQQDDYSEKLKQAISSQGLDKEITTLGFRSDPFELYNQADLCLVTSKMEAFGRITIEAMKLGKPVIGTRSGETPYLIEEFRTGLLYNYNDSTELAEKIEYCYNNQDKLQLMKEEAQSYASSNFNRELFRNEMNRLLENLVH